MTIFGILKKMVLPKSFYKKDVVSVAKDLLGTFLVTDLPEGKTVGRIIETESYLSENDPASHSFKGKTVRNKDMFGPPGHAYIYLIYGMHYCFNVVTGDEGVGEAVLIRALEPVEGFEIMKKRRGISDPFKLCDGPGKLTQAMGITKSLSGTDLTGKSIYILSSSNKSVEIVTSCRVGISVGKEMLLRFCIKET